MAPFAPHAHSHDSTGAHASTGAHDSAGAHADAIILGIETSCDETAAAVVRRGRVILSSVVASQIDLHREYGGVVPEIAGRAHVERILPTVRLALDRARVGPGDLAAVAVAHRPGLIGSLLVGVAAAKALAWSLGVPLLGVDHVHAHLHAGLLGTELDHAQVYPALGLVVSGGHTALYRLEGPLDPVRLGATIDDALGEAYDKAASILGLPYPGGPEIDRLAQEPGADAAAVDLPVSRLGPESLDFSFSGLKTALLYAAKGAPAPPPRRDGRTIGPAPAPPLDDARRRDLAASFQRAAVAAVALKLERAARVCPGLRSIIAGGGVTANSALRSALADAAQRLGARLVLPPPSLCVDNAAMIAALAHERLRSAPPGRPVGDALDLAPVPTTAC